MLNRHLLILIFGCGNLLSKPGDVLPDEFPLLTSPASKSRIEVTANGTVIVIGNFHQVDGVFRPGIVKLGNDGQVDPNFAPTTGTKANDSGFMGYGRMGTYPPEENHLFVTESGRVFVTGMNGWELWNPDGSVDETSMAEFPRKNAERPIPQFERDGVIYFVAQQDWLVSSRLLAYDAGTLEPAPFATNSLDFPHPAFQAVDAGDDKIWVLGREPIYADSSVYHYFQVPGYSLSRILSDGSLDPTFTPVVLQESYAYSIMASSDEGLFLGKTYPPSSWITNGFGRSTTSSLTVEKWSVDGEVLETTHIEYPMGTQEMIAVDAGGGVIYSNSDSIGWVRKKGEIIDEDFQLAAASGWENPIALLPDGKIQVADKGRFLSDGSPDPSWTPPAFQRSGGIEKLLSLSDGGVLVTGQFLEVEGQPGAALIKLHSDGTVDPSFEWDPELGGSDIVEIHERFDGSLLVHLQSPPSLIAGERTLAIVIVDSLGGLQQDVELYLESELPRGQMTIYDIHPVSDGSFFVVGSAINSSSNSPARAYYKVDPSRPLAERTWNFASELTLEEGFFPLNDGRYILSSTLYSQNFTPEKDGPDFKALGTPLGQLSDGSVIFLKPQLYSLISRLKKWHPETGEDVDFESDPLINWYTGTIIEDEKGFIYLMNASESFFPVESKILRFHPSGQLDVTFKPEVPTQMDGVLRSFAIVEDQEETSLWAGGAFARFDGNETSGLVRLDLAETHGFSEWISAAARGTS
ncbi:delta-60 repeat domain-containing protein [Verrucomicrobiaceae bacterium 227]